jgi:hypothetical protein
MLIFSPEKEGHEVIHSKSTANPQSQKARIGVVQQRLAAHEFTGL